MRKFLGKLGEAIPGPLLHAATLFLLISPAVCHALDPCSNHPTPTITSITPDVWFAGQTYNNVNFTGTNLNSTVESGTTCPVVIVVNMDTGAVSLEVTSQSSTQIMATVKPDRSDPIETACVTAAIFFPLVVRAAESSNATPAAGAAGSTCTDPDGNQGITVAILGTPKMLWNDKRISVTGDADPTPQNAVVGQQIKLITKPKAEELAALGLAFSENTWTVDGTRIAGYAPTVASAKVKKLTDADLKKDNITFYWVYAKDDTLVTYKYCVDIPGLSADDIANDLNCSLVAKAAFNVTGPGDAQMTTDGSGTFSISNLIVSPCLPGDLAPFMEYGSSTGYDEDECPNLGGETGTPGITFLAPEASSSGQYSFVQKVDSDSVVYTQQGGSLLCGDTPGFDGKTYPTATGASTSDSPDVPLDAFDLKARRTFKATMYLMWTTSNDPSSIPVPIGYQKWSFQERSTNPGAPTNQSWTEPTSQYGGPVGDFVPSIASQPHYGYPTWDGQTTFSCPTSKTAADVDEEEEEQ